MAIDAYSDIGGLDDQIVVRIDGQDVKDYENYSLRRAVLTQPSTCSFTFGNGQIASKLLTRLRPGLEISVRIGFTQLFNGYIEDVTAAMSAGGTSVTVEGRDWLGFLMRYDVPDERQLGSPTYYDLTRYAMNQCGLEDHILMDDNDVDRRKLSRVRNIVVPPPKQVVKSIELPRPGNEGAKIQYQTIKCELGHNWFDFLMAQFKRVGLYLWCAGTGDLLLYRVIMPTTPIYKIWDMVGLDRSQTNIISGNISNKLSQRHAHCRVFGRGYADKKGVRPIRGEAHDEEMIKLGFDNWKVVHDSEATTPDDCAYVARRALAEERRQGRSITYVMSGHTTPSIDGNYMAVWTPDTSVILRSDRLSFSGEPEGIEEPLYVESVEFARQPQTQTTLHLMRKSDIMYLGEKSDLKEKSPVPQAPKVKRRKK